MAESKEASETTVSLRALREEIASMRAEQREMARALEELNRTFRALTNQLGIVAEPYRKHSGSSQPDLPGFG